MADQARDTSFDRIAILVLAVEWVLFGSMHFSAVDATVAQIPTDISDVIKHHLAIVTGIAEVATGILVLVPELRKKAAVASLVLLGLLVPAMYKILSNPSSVEILGAGATAFRIVLLPNNIFMAICAIHLWRHPDASLARPARLPRRVRPRWSFGDPVTLIVPGLLLMANIAGFLAVTVGAAGRLGTAFLWAMACIAVGALTGFLFGVPRANPAAATGPFLHNTNVEAVSDWLTKILVGVGLVNFQAIGGFVDRLAFGFAHASSSVAAFGTALIVYFFVIGIIQGYVLTRLFLAPRFATV
ncbi:MAG: hypothetical protein JWO81_1996 [Alphaproteobacteria bacterium]|nr:hypothetical protein [Alphaproteobacteria bacterium]